MKKLFFFAFILSSSSLIFANDKKSANFTVLEKIKASSPQKVMKGEPVKLTSSCGYVRWIEFIATDNPTCLLVELADMEDDCNAPVDGEWYV